MNKLLIVCPFCARVSSAELHAASAALLVWAIWVLLYWWPSCGWVAVGPHCDPTGMTQPSVCAEGSPEVSVKPVGFNA